MVRCRWTLRCGIVVWCLLAAACAPVRDVRLNTPETGPLPAEAFGTFDMVLMSSDAARLTDAEMELRVMISDWMKWYGFTRTVKEPDLIVDSRSSSERRDRYVPPSYASTPQWDDYDLSPHQRDLGPTFQPTAYEGYEQPEYRHTILLRVYRVPRVGVDAETGATPELIWEGDVSAVAETSDIRNVANDLIGRLMRSAFGAKPVSQRDAS